MNKNYSVLIISDNPFLCKSVYAILQDTEYDTYTFTYATGKQADLRMFEPVSTRRLDLRSADDVDFIIKNYELVISLHCKQLFPKKLVDTVRCINIHPGYNPVNRGWYPQVFAILHNLPVGATIHEIDYQLDHGNIIDREFVEKNDSDNSFTLYNKILAREIELFRKNIKSILENNYKAYPPETEGNLFLKKDFEALCRLDMEQMGTFRDFYNLLRALSHGDFKNAYFIDETTHKKVYLSLNIEPE